MSSLPSAQQFARAVVRSAAALGEDGATLLEEQGHSKARLVALAVLHEVSDGASYIGLARLLRFDDPTQASALLGNARKAKWWSEALIDEIVGELVADTYGERAA
jgi:hypothetical protein